MKNLSSGTLADLASPTQTFNTCWYLKRTDGTVFSWTDCDQQIIVGGVTYAPTDGYSPSANEGHADFSVDNMELAGFLDSPSITEADVANGKWDFALVRVFMVNRNAISNGTYEMRYGTLGQVKIQAPGKYTAEIRGLSQRIQNTIGSLVTPTCRWIFGDVDAYGNAQPQSHCAVNAASFTVSPVSVTTVSSTMEFAASSLTQAAGYFSMGVVKWLTGANAGVAMDVAGHATGGVILLQLPMVEPIAIGDTFSIRAGCMKRYSEDCVTKFSNGINFGGYKDIPGLDKVIRPGSF